MEKGDRAALLEDTCSYWQKRTSREVTQEDARQMIENASGFFTTLLQWAAAEEHSSADSKTEAA